MIASTNTNAINNGVQGNDETDLINVVKSFGMRFFTLTVQHKVTCPTCFPNGNSPEGEPRVNAFQYLMNSAREALGQDLPKIKENPKKQQREAEK